MRVTVTITYLDGTTSSEDQNLPTPEGEDAEEQMLGALCVDNLNHAGRGAEFRSVAFTFHSDVVPRD